MILMAAVLFSLVQSYSPPSATDLCVYDPKSLDLGFDAFDQDPAGGWRALSAKPGCESTAADMIRAYRMNQESRIPLLFWHEAQLRASIGDYGSAVGLMERSRQPAKDDRYGWNAYVDATIAFLRGDKSALNRARDQLLQLTKPDAASAEGTWPPNIAVVDALIRCFGQPYKIAYGATCRVPRP
ncbi:hypothetical protein [Sphingomonas sp.]|uniref:hypothetical protein n=1 Tax=Sphingomonas sp. TaxID=28214 RepID=UPI0035AE1B1A